MPDLAEISQTSGVAVRKLRYVLDHQILPGAQDTSQGRGTVRSFTPFEAFGLVVAVLMLRAGLRRALVRDCLAALTRGFGRNVDQIPFYKAFAHGEPARLEVGDWKYVRLTVAAHLIWPASDTGWLALDKGRPPGDSYTPLVCLVMNVGQIRRLIPRSNAARVVGVRDSGTEAPHSDS
jgi:hypothetical protein